MTSADVAAPPLVITSDEALREHLMQLAAAAGVPAEAVLGTAAALRSWPHAPVVLVGDDAAAGLTRHGPPRRTGVHVVARDRPADDLFRVALALGAEGIVEVATAQEWLVELFSDAGEPPARGCVVAVMAGSGGAGATTFACALAQVVGARGPTVVIDTDPLGPGADLVLGLEAEPGFRWDALELTTGRFSGAALRSALPRRGGVGVLTWLPAQVAAAQPFAVREALTAARRGHDLVVVDLSRTPGGPVLEQVALQCDRLVVVVVPTVTGVASAARVVARLRDHATPSLVVRGRGLDAAAVAAAVGSPVLAVVPEQRTVRESVDLGLGPVRSLRGPLARACRVVLGGLDGHGDLGDRSGVRAGAA